VLEVLKRALNLYEKLHSSSATPELDRYEADIMWLLIGKAAVQTFGAILNTLLDRSLALDREVGYWDEVLESAFYTALYTAQTAPSRVWIQANDFYSHLKAHYTNDDWLQFGSLTGRWGRFYQVVQRSIQERSQWNPRKTLLTPFARCRSEVRQMRKTLKDSKDLTASGIGLLMEECFAFGSGDDNDHVGRPSTSNLEWHNVVYKSVLLMDMILQNLSSSGSSLNEFEEEVFNAVDSELPTSQNQPGDNSRARIVDAMNRMIHILQQRYSENVTVTDNLIRNYGRPSRLIRYWLPACTVLLSLSTSLRILANRKAELLTWLSEFGLTVVDFWTNWVIKPTEKLIGTIRHDEQIAIMSRNSLVADRASLERMVIDFVRDHHESGQLGTQPDIDVVSANVREGDLTPVLKAYERDLRKPLMGTVRGDLIRALLIQIQKTKVDVEVAIGGIDALLKSQELVFGYVSLSCSRQYLDADTFSFVGLTPGILVSYASFRWLGSVLGNRKGIRKGNERQSLRRSLRYMFPIYSLFSSRN
jgi:nuclear-control-of-ATPase protein 2